MKVFIPLLLCIVLMSTLVSAHTLERKVIIRSDGNYNVQFSSEPKYPITGKSTHLDFVIWDNKGDLLTRLDLAIEMQKAGKVFSLNAIETEPGHYSIDYNAEEFGVYELSPVINNEKLDIRFDLYFDTFWPKGLLPVGAIALFLITLLTLMYKDCRGKK